MAKEWQQIYITRRRITKIEVSKSREEYLDMDAVSVLHKFELQQLEQLQAGPDLSHSSIPNARFCPPVK